ncbi:MAG: hypothetical protein V1745_04195 [Patescibacteria group bacterium]
METVVSGKEISNIEADEQAYEQSQESKETFLEQERPVEPAPPTPVQDQAATTIAAAAHPMKDEVVVHVEKIMEEGLGSLYASLPDNAKPIFRTKGEEAAIEISGMIRSLKFKAARALRLLRDWLLTIPKANRFFLEQEAKIKTDRILEYVEARREEMTKQP